MAEAVIISTARTPIGTTCRGALNSTNSPGMGACAIREAATCADFLQRSQSMKVGRKVAIAASLFEVA